MTARPLPPIEFLRECFSYDPDTGAFVWKLRPEHHFERESIARVWNLRFAGSPAFISVERNGGYLKAEVVYKGSRYRLRASRVAYKFVTGEEHPLIDHENRVVTDNRFKNLRPATNTLNMANTIGRPDKVLPKGVFSEKGKFVASMSVGNRKQRLGRFASPAEAHAAYCAAARAQHGEFFNPGPERPSIFD